MAKTFKSTKIKPKKFKCELCEEIVMKSYQMKVRKNYSHGRKSKPTITRIHRCDGGVLIELKRKRE